jgi:hypothetical protein
MSPTATDTTVSPAAVAVMAAELTTELPNDLVDDETLVEEISIVCAACTDPRRVLGSRVNSHVGDT